MLFLLFISEHKCPSDIVYFVIHKARIKLQITHECIYKTTKTRVKKLPRVFDSFIREFLHHVTRDVQVFNVRQQLEEVEW